MSDYEPNSSRDVGLVGLHHDVDLLGGWPRQQYASTAPPVVGAEPVWVLPEYVSVVFESAQTLDELVVSVQNLAQDLEENQLHAGSVRTFKVFGWSDNSGSHSEKYTESIKALDHSLAQVITRMWRLKSFSVDLSKTRTYHPLPSTLTQVLCLQGVPELLVRGVIPPSFSKSEASHLRPSSFHYAPGFERIDLDITSTDWFSYLVEDPRNIRWLSLHKADCTPLDRATAMAMNHLARYGHNLEVLVVSSLVQLFNLDCYSSYFENAFQQSWLPKLRAVSFDLVTTPHSLQRLIRGYAWSNITHMRLVVNQNGTWVQDFGPRYVHLIADQAPDLEELCLDQVGMVLPSSLPGDLKEWGAAFRRFENLRCIGLASMFVLDFSGPYTGPDWASDSSDSDSSFDGSRSPSPLHDVTMRDDGDVFKFSPSPQTHRLSNVSADAEVSRSTSPPTSPRPSSSSSLFSVSSSGSSSAMSDMGGNVISGTVWVENFLDNYLRMPSLQCLFLLGVKPPTNNSEETHYAICGAGLGYEQVVEKVVEECEGHGEQCQFQGLVHDQAMRRVCGGSKTKWSFIVKKAMRDGWWWEDMGRSGIL